MKAEGQLNSRESIANNSKNVGDVTPFPEPEDASTRWVGFHFVTVEDEEGDGGEEDEIDEGEGGGDDGEEGGGRSNVEDGEKSDDEVGEELSFERVSEGRRDLREAEKEEEEGGKLDQLDVRRREKERKAKTHNSWKGKPPSRAKAHVIRGVAS